MCLGTEISCNDDPECPDCPGPPFAYPALCGTLVSIPAGTVPDGLFGAGNVVRAALSAVCPAEGITIDGVPNSADITATSKDLPFDVCINGERIVPGPARVNVCGDVAEGNAPLATGDLEAFEGCGGLPFAAVPALAAPGAIAFLLLVTGALIVVYRRRSRNKAA
jgi:hypothetical protein